MVLGYNIFSGGIERGYNSTVKRLQPVDRSSPIEPMFRFDSLKVQPVADLQASARQASTTSAMAGAAAVPKEGSYRGTVPSSPTYQKKVVELQRLFLKNDGKMVWQKRGMRDLPLYYGLLTIMVVGVGTSMYQLYKLANKKN